MAEWQKSVPCRYFMIGSCAKNENCSFSHDVDGQSIDYSPEQEEVEAEYSIEEYPPIDYVEDSGVVYSSSAVEDVQELNVGISSVCLDPCEDPNCIEDSSFGSQNYTESSQEFGGSGGVYAASPTYILYTPMYQAPTLSPVSPTISVVSPNTQTSASVAANVLPSVPGVTAVTASPACENTVVTDINSQIYEAVDCSIDDSVLSPSTCFTSNHTCDPPAETFLYPMVEPEQTDQHTFDNSTVIQNSDLDPSQLSVYSEVNTCLTQSNSQSTVYQSTLNPQTTEFQSTLNPQTTEFQSTLNPQTTEFQSALNPKTTKFQSTLNPQITEFQSGLNPQPSEFQSTLNPQITEFQPKTPTRPLNPETSEFSPRSSTSSTSSTSTNFSTPTTVSEGQQGSPTVSSMQTTSCSSISTSITSLNPDPPEFVPKARVEVSESTCTEAVTYSLNTSDATSATPRSGSSSDPPVMVELRGNKPWTAPINWAEAPEFVPKKESKQRSWAQVVNSNLNNQETGCTLAEVESQLCPYFRVGECRYDSMCIYIHGEYCDYCGQNCLHPTHQEQRRSHLADCLREHERDMELSFAVARSREKTCGICMETVLDKPKGEARFGILPSCNHCFCLPCIRKWRQAKQFEHKIIRACPECRQTSDFICPSRYWVETQEEKDQLLSDYKKNLGLKECKYFNKGAGECPFGNKCFYSHADKEGRVVDVGPPKKPARRANAEGNLTLVQRLLLYDFLEERDGQLVFPMDFVELFDLYSDSDDWSDDEA